MLRIRLALTTLTLATSLVSFAAYTLLLRYLGASPQVDLLFYAASIPASLAGLASAVLLYLLPPALVRLGAQRQEYAVTFLAWAVELGGALAALIAIGGLLAQHFAAFWTLSLGFSLVAALSVMSTLTVCLAQARGEYLRGAIAPLFTSLGLMLGAVVAVITRAAWLLLFGQLVGTLVAAWWLARELKLPLWTSTRSQRRHGLAAVAPAGRHLPAIILGTTAFSLLQPVDALLSTRLGSGAVSVMAYSQRVWVAVSTAISLGAFATAARTSYDAYRQGGRPSLRRLANREVARILLFGFLAWLLYVLFAHALLARILLSSAMSRSDMQRVVECVGWMLSGVGPVTAVPYLFRIFYTLEIYWVPAVIGITIAPAYGLLAWRLMDQAGILALPYALAVVWWTALITALVCINHDSCGSDSVSGGSHRS